MNLQWDSVESPFTCMHVINTTYHYYCSFSLIVSQESGVHNLVTKGDLLLVGRSEVVVSVFEKDVEFLAICLMCWLETCRVVIIAILSDDRRLTVVLAG
jgi:hypothetical protein